MIPKILMLMRKAQKVNIQLIIPDKVRKLNIVLNVVKDFLLESM